MPVPNLVITFENQTCTRYSRGLRSVAYTVRWKMARQSELCRCRRDLPLAVGLHDTARDDRIGALCKRLVQHVVELAQLVAAETKPGGVFTLDPQPRSAEMGRQSLHRLERRRQIGQTQAGKDSESVD